MAVILDGGETVDVGVDGQLPPQPPPDPEKAPKGWRVDRKTKTWIPRERAPKGAREDAPEEPPAAAQDSAWATGPDGKQRLGGDDPDDDFVPLTTEQQDDVVAILELFSIPLLTAAESRDPYCGAALAENWDHIRDKSLPLIARSPALVEWLTKAGGARDWLAFAAAVRPVATAVVRHHITKTVTLDEDGHEHVDDLGRFHA